MDLIKPNKLKKGDKIAVVSLSWGGAGDEGIHDRYLTAKARLEKDFGFEVVAMPHALKGSDFVYHHPELRAKDLMDAFRDESIKGIFCAIGGDDTIRLMPYIDYEVIANNPKAFMGYSDTTTNHFMMLKAGVQSYYGPSILMEFAENVKMHDYTKNYFMKALMGESQEVEITHASEWTCEYLPWHIKENNEILRQMTKDTKGYEVLQGKGRICGPLIGGCLEVLDMMRGTALWPDLSLFEDTILFIETSEEQPSPDYVKYVFRSFAAMGIFNVISGIIIGKPKDEKFYEDYKQVIQQVVSIEEGKHTLPIIYNANFGHTSPMFVLPYGAQCTLDCDSSKVYIRY